MKKQLTRTPALLARAIALCGLLAAPAAFTDASAQTARTIFVRVPFEFVAGDKRLPAGDYTFARAVRDSDRTLLIRGDDGRPVAAVHTNAARPRPSSANAELVFTRRGGQYFLALVSTPGGDTARALVKSRVERSVERELADAAAAKGNAEARAGAETVTVVGAAR